VESRHPAIDRVLEMVRAGAAMETVDDPADVS
jgi:hypothetical protein